MFTVLGKICFHNFVVLKAVADVVRTGDVSIVEDAVREAMKEGKRKGKWHYYVPIKVTEDAKRHYTDGIHVLTLRFRSEVGETSASITEREDAREDERREAAQMIEEESGKWKEFLTSDRIATLSKAASWVEEGWILFWKWKRGRMRWSSGILVGDKHITYLSPATVIWGSEYFVRKSIFTFSTKMAGIFGEITLLPLSA